MIIRTLASLAAVFLLMLSTASAAAAAAAGNDGIENAVEVNDFPADLWVDTTEATAAEEDTQLRCNGVSTGHTVWYRFTPQRDTRFLAYVGGDGIDTVATVVTGEPGALTVAACNDDDDDGYDSLWSTVEWSAAAGETYYLMVGTYEDTPGGETWIYIEELLEMSVQFDEPSFSVTNGTATLRGTVNCSIPAEVYLEAESLSQDRAVGPLDAQGTGDAEFTCDGVTPFAFTVTPSAGRFFAGDAILEYFAVGCGEADWFDCKFIERTVETSLSRPAL